MKVLLFSSLYPSTERPIHGIFVETRLRELVKTGQIEARVVAPVPWFPFKAKRFGEYAKFAMTPKFERRNELDVHHPRYLQLPRFGMSLAPFTMALGALPTLRRLQREGFDFDLIDAHYYYPDGVAAGLLAQWLGKPFIVTARGTDLNLIPTYRLPRKLIVKTAQKAFASIGVCQALVDSMRSLGATENKLYAFRNGVDLQRFRPESRAEARRKLNLQQNAKYLLSVGHLVERKGHHVVIEALAELPSVKLIIVGTGPERRPLEALATRLGVNDRVNWAGEIPQVDLKWWYSGADALVLCSSREGWPNVLLESMACGTPVIATKIWGTPEIVQQVEAGVLMEDRTSKSLCEAWRLLQSNDIKRETTRAYSEQYSWHSTTWGQIDLFTKAMELGSE